MDSITVFPARRVITMDPGRPVAEAIAVMNGKVLSTGSCTSMQPWPSTPHVIDDRLKTKVIATDAPALGRSAVSSQASVATLRYWMRTRIRYTPIALKDIGIWGTALSGMLHPPEVSVLTEARSVGGVLMLLELIDR